MTFNIRYDGFERDPNNHFTKRVYRLTETVKKWQPSILGIQEPFTNQLLHWQSLLPKYYVSIGYQRVGLNQTSENLSSQRDFQVAILYNTQELKLIENDYIWLSKTPRIVNSKDWGSSSPRTLNIARFQIQNSDKPTTFLVFNTHLDVKSEQARREQAKLIRQTIQDWQSKYPTDPIVLLGDFNSIPKQVTHSIFTSSNFLLDTWIVCKSDKMRCISNSFSSTFHGWFGTLVNTYGLQFLQAILYTFHGSGASLPYQISGRLSFYVDVLTGLWKSRHMLKFSDIISAWSQHRFHVDWILYRNSDVGNIVLQPRFIAVADVRSNNFSSDHFPVVALFELKEDKEHLINV